MNDFLSNIDIGVFDLDDVLKNGFSSIVPDRFRNQVKQQEKKLENIIRERSRILRLMKDATGDQKKALRKVMKERNISDQQQRIEQAKVERKMRSKTLGGKFQNFSTTMGGRMALAGGALFLRDIQKTFSQIQEQVEETGFFSSRLLSDYDNIAGKARNIVMSGERLYNVTAQNFDTFVDLRREFGETEDLSLKTLDNISQLENIIGLSNEEATELLSTFKGINQNSIQANTALIKTFSVLANQNGVAFRDVMQDITDNADFFATYMADSSEKMGELIVKSRKMGLSFSTFANALGQFTEIESTIEKQMRLSIFAGQQLDLVSIMENVYSGNIQQAGQQLLAQVGGVNSGLLNNPLVKQQFMDALGMEATQFNKLVKTAKQGPTFQDRINKDLSDGLEDFNENFKQLGFATLKKDFTQFIINPLSNLFKSNRTQIQNLIEGIGDIIKVLGSITTGIGKSIIWFQELTQSTVATLTGVGAMIAGVSKLTSTALGKLGIEGQQLTELRHIKFILAHKFGDDGAFGGFMGGKVGKGLKVAGGVATGLAVAGGAGYAGYQADEFDRGTLISSIVGGGLAGGGYGMLTGNPIGALAGLGIGAVIGGGSYLAGRALSPNVKMARGGIFNKRYTGMMDIGETGKPEALTPLDTEDGKPTMPTKLADDSIKKLTNAIRGMKFVGQVKMPDGSKKTMEFYDSVMQPSSALNT